MNNIPRRPLVKPLALTVGGLVLAVAVARLVIPRAIPVETVVIARAPFEETLRTDGRIEARDKYTVTAFADGDLRRVTLRVGDRVKKGDPVARLLWDYEKELKSPVDGVVSRVHRETAGPIQRGTLILEIADTRRLEVVAEFLTSDAVRVRPGMPLRIEGWGGETPLVSRVANVSRAGYTKTSALGVEEERTDVRGDLTETPPDILSRLGNNYHVDVTVVVSTEAAALTVPLGAVFRNGEDWAVYRVENQRAQTTPVILGRRNDKDALVREGLQPGDRVILYPGDHIKPGVRVKTIR